MLFSYEYFYIYLESCRIVGVANWQVGRGGGGLVMNEENSW